MASLTDLYPLVRRKCPSVIDLMMLDALRDAYKEFAYVSEALTEQVTVNDAKANLPTKINIKQDHTLLKVESVKQVISAKSDRQLYVHDDYLVMPPDELQTSKDYTTLNALVVIVPTEKIQPDQADDRLIALYGDAIAAGAAAALRMMPSEIWANADLAMDLRREFSEGARRAYRDRRDGYSTFRNKTRKRNFY